MLDEVSAELGWKIPDHTDLKITDIDVNAGQIRLICDLTRPRRLDREEMDGALEHSARARRFLSDYEAKQLYSNTEAMIQRGRLERAARHYDRQCELHPENLFLTTRLMQLQLVAPNMLPDAADTASRRLLKYENDTDALLTLANVHWQRQQFERAAEILEQVADAAERRGDQLEAAQARCALAEALSDINPERALDALQSALGLRRGLVGARLRLAELQSRAGDWSAALKTRGECARQRNRPRTSG